MQHHNGGAGDFPERGAGAPAPPGCAGRLGRPPRVALGRLGLPPGLRWGALGRPPGCAWRLGLPRMSHTCCHVAYLLWCVITAIMDTL